MKSRMYRQAGNVVRMNVERHARDCYVGQDEGWYPPCECDWIDTWMGYPWLRVGVKRRRVVDVKVVCLIVAKQCVIYLRYWPQNVHLATVLTTVNEKNVIVHAYTILMGTVQKKNWQKKKALNL